MMMMARRGHRDEHPSRAREGAATEEALATLTLTFLIACFAHFHLHIVFYSIVVLFCCAGRACGACGCLLLCWFLITNHPKICCETTPF